MAKCQIISSDWLRQVGKIHIKLVMPKLGFNQPRQTFNLPILFLFQCVAGFTGGSCETNINDCDILPCQNSGTCVDGVNSFQCNCIHYDWYGNTCQNGEFTQGQFFTVLNTWVKMGQFFSRVGLPDSPHQRTKSHAELVKCEPWFCHFGYQGGALFTPYMSIGSDGLCIQALYWKRWIQDLVLQLY